MKSDVLTDTEPIRRGATTVQNMDDQKSAYVDGRPLAKQKLSRFARKLLVEWTRLQLPVNTNRLLVAVSGGADSTALLLGLDELRKSERLSCRITVCHLDHGLRGEDSVQDAKFVNALAIDMGYEVEMERIDVRERAEELRDNLEQAARRARYQFLFEAAKRYDAEAVLTGHTMDDQAETMLLRLMRGSGLEGLGGIKPVRVLEKDNPVLLVRPLLRWARRADTESYCHDRGISFRADAMNDDQSFARVRVRKQLLPMMQTFNSRIVEALSRTAGLLQKDESALEIEAEELLSRSGFGNADGVGGLNVDVLADAQAAVRRRALRQWIAHTRGDVKRLDLVHLVAVEKLIFGERGGRIAELPGGSSVKRSRGKLIFEARHES